MGDNTQNKRRLKWSFTVGLVLGTTLIVIFAFVYKLPTVYKYEADSLRTDEDTSNTAFASVASINKEEASPYLKTGFSDVFFTLDSSNAISFFEYSDEKFVKLKTTSSLPVTLNVYGSEVEITLSLITRDGVTEGYGVYTDFDSTECPYVFARLTENNVTDDCDYLIYTDCTIADLYKNNKSFSFVFAANSASESTEKLFADRDAISGKNGFVRKGFILIPSDFAGDKADAFYFLSDRSYEAEKSYDLYEKTELGETEKAVISGISAPYLFTNKGDVYFFMTPETDSSVFYLCRLDDGESKRVRSFPGTPEQYVVRGNYIFNPSTKRIYNVFSDFEEGLTASISISAVQDFAVSSDENRLAVAGNFAGNSEKLMFCNLSSNKTKVIDGTGLFVSGNPNMTFVGDSVYFLSPASLSDRVTNFVISWDAIFSLK